MFRGERFNIDLSSDEDETPKSHSKSTSTTTKTNPPPESLFANLIGDIQERKPSTSSNNAAPSLPKAPSLGTTDMKTGFPAARVRTSRFKAQRSGSSQPTTTTVPASATATTTPAPIASNTAPSSSSTNSNSIQSFEESQKRDIDRENRDRLAAMSSAQIERERQELMEGMSPALLQRLLRRANIEEDQKSGFESASFRAAKETEEKEKKKKEGKGKSVSFAAEEVQEKEDKKNVDEGATAIVPPPTAKSFQTSALVPDQPPQSQPDLQTTTTTDPDAAPLIPPSDLHHPSDPIIPFHFPPPPNPGQAPTLDPTSPSFLSDLQSHYFPNLPHNPESLSWLSPSSADEAETSAYRLDAASIGIKNLRFDFQGSILTPSTALNIPSTKGLHHHSDDPDAAGYTIPEIARLARSSVPAQRCIAYSLIGKVLYRLGSGAFGARGTELVEGLWAVVENERVVEALMWEAGESVSTSSSKAESATGDGNAVKKEDGVKDGDEDVKSTTSASASGSRHASARAYAIEALWLWRSSSHGERGLRKEGVVMAK